MFLTPSQEEEEVEDEENEAYREEEPEQINIYDNNPTEEPEIEKEKNHMDINIHHPTKEDSYQGITEGVEEEDLLIDDYNEEAERRRQKELERGNRDLEREIRDMEREKRKIEVSLIYHTSFKYTHLSHLSELSTIKFF